MIYATIDYVDSELSKKANISHTHDELHSHVNKTVLDGITSSKVNEWNNKSTFSGSYNDLTNKPEGLATENYVQQKIAEASLNGGEVDLSDYYTKSEVDNKDQAIDDKITVLNAKVDNLDTNGNLVFRDVEQGEIFAIEGGSGVIVPPTITYGNIVLSTTSLSFNENASGTFTVKLDKTPTNNQEVILSINNAYCTLSQSSLTFTPSNYSTAQTIVVTGVHDSTHYSDKSSVITISNPNVSSKNISVTIKNIDVKEDEGDTEIPETPTSRVRFDFDYNKYVDGETTYTYNGITATLNSASLKTENGVQLKDGNLLEVPYVDDLLKPPYTIEIVGRKDGVIHNKSYPLLDVRYSKGSGNGFVISKNYTPGIGLNPDLTITGVYGYSATAMSNFSIENGEEFNLKFVYNGTTIKTYSNGILQSTNNLNLQPQRNLLVMGLNYNTFFEGCLKKFTIYDGEVL